MNLSRRDTTCEARSGAMQEVYARAARVAPVDSTVLITGESGVGKERLARFLHDASHRAKGPFVPISCCAVAESLLESELFGHVRGAFTGAAQDRAGLFEAAHGGTLFLDEIGDIAPGVQVKLLRVIQERELRRLGETKLRSIDVRLLAATNRDLATEVAAQRFRADLYYRLRVIQLHVPPLRECPEDLETLANALLMSISARLGRPIVGYTRRARARILRYGWPGNIRELEHAIEAACVVARTSRIDLSDLPEVVQRMSPPTGVRPLDDVERDTILTALARNEGSQRRTAAQLRISMSTLRRRLRAYRQATDELRNLLRNAKS